MTDWIGWDAVAEKARADIDRLNKRLAEADVSVQRASIKERIAARQGVVEAIKKLEGVHLSRFTRDFDQIKPWIPARVNSFLDIGCGSGRLAVLLAQYYPGARVNLLDGDDRIEPEGKEQVGYCPTATQPWNSRHAAVDLVKTKVPGAMVVGYPPYPNQTIPADLIVSMKSWGHHYGIPVYLDMVLRSLRTGGILILDLREEKDGLAQLKAAGFKHLKELPQTTVKCRRHVFAR